nr:transposase [Halocella sp. SP3-1]
MSYKFNPYLSVGIDVGADFSMMSMTLPNQQLLGKPFKIIHNRLDSLASAVLKIKKAEELNSLKARIFLESTGIYHFPLFCYLKEAGFDVFVINPLISNSSRNLNIRKVHNDKFDSKKAALLGLNPNLKVSLVPTDLVLNLRNLTREYFNLVDSRSAYVNKLLGQLRGFSTVSWNLLKSYWKNFSDDLAGIYYTTKHLVCQQRKANCFYCKDF